MASNADDAKVGVGKKACRQVDRNGDKASSSDHRRGRLSTGKRKRQKFASGELPSPPPNPDAKCCSDSVERLENSASKAAVTAVGVADAFDHLDKLHTMIAEILEMRDRNAKLFKRVRDLERVKATRTAHTEVEKCISMGQDPLLPDEDVGFAESLLGAMLSSSYELSPGRSTLGRASPSSNRTTRSLSAGTEHRRVSCPITAESQYRNSIRISRTSESQKKRPSLAIGTPKVSKWTRVKAAFKWERAACTANDVPMEPEISVRYLRIPENIGGSSEVSGPPTPAGTISSSSSVDDVFHRPRRPSSNQSSRITRRDDNSFETDRRSRSLDGDASVPMTLLYSPRTRSKDNASFQTKSVDSTSRNKTPWGKVKDMMQLRRESLGRYPMRSGSRNEDAAHSTSSLDSSDIHRSEQQTDGKPPRVRITAESPTSTIGSSSKPNDLVDLASRRLTPTLTITVPSSEELRCVSSPESITPPPQESGKSERYCQQDGYDTPKETRTGQVSPASSGSGILRYGLGRSKTCQGLPFGGDFKRQQSLKGESLGSSPKMHRRDSKWNKVKRAFLTSATSVPTSPSRISSYFFDDAGDGSGVRSYSASASAEDLETEISSNPGAQAEIQRNYKLLHDKLGTEFNRKLAEWEKLKIAAGRETTKCHARDKDAESLRLPGEERLTPEFKKKLEEWKRMHKSGSNSCENRSVNRRRITDWQLWRSSPTKPDSPRLSEDFIKKMEEWKRIKSASTRRDAEFEVETGQRQRQRREIETAAVAEVEEGKERSVFGERRKAWKSLEDDEFRSLERVLDAMEIDRRTGRLSKVEKMVGSLPPRTEEVLIHTSSGLYRFEGISRKFTRKLYEWEKSQGISPELSTFRLLDPLLRYDLGRVRARATPIDVSEDGAPRRIRHRSKSVGSVQIDYWRTRREDEKPPIRRPSSLSLNDIDNREARSCIFASRSIPDEEEDTSEDIAMEDSEPEPEAVIVDIEDVIEETASPLRKYQPHQTPVYSVAGSETTSIAIPLGTVTARHEPSPVILIEPDEIHPSRGRVSRQDSETDNPAVSPSASSLERSIVGGRRTKRRDTERVDKLSRNDRVDNSETDIIDVTPTTITHDTSDNWQMALFTVHDGDGGTLEARVSEEEEDAVVTVRGNARHSKKILKTRRLTDTQVGYEWRTRNEASTSAGDFENNPNVERIIINEDTLNKIVVPTASSSGRISEAADDKELRDGISRKEKREARSVFVKTKRIVFSPFRRDGKNKSVESSIVKAEQVDKSVIDWTPSSSSSTSRRISETRERPPLPKSPILSRKEYRVPSSPTETASSSIRIMIRRYNEKLESETRNARRAISSSANSSGSSSPINPDGRLLTRMERYDDAMKPVGNATGPSKSASADFFHKNSNRDVRTFDQLSNVRSASMMNRVAKPVEIHNDRVSSSSLRAIKIRRAKEDFFSRETSSDDRKIEADDRLEISSNDEEPTTKEKEIRANDDRSIAVKSDLAKSASAGMINVDADTYERLATAAKRGCDSLPRSNEHLRQRARSKETSTSRFSQIASKFKRAKLRRAKEREGRENTLSTVSMLCRQSLLVDIANDSAGSEEISSASGEKSSSSDPTTPDSRPRKTS